MIATDDLLARFEQTRRIADGQWMALCPAHGDRNPSLHVTRGADRWLLSCQAGCAFDAVCEAAKISKADLFESNGNRREIVATYPYTDEHGQLLSEVVRFTPKGFAQRRLDGNGGWEWKLGKTRRVLFQLPQVIEAVARGETIYVAEGEEDVLALERAGKAATTNPGGAGKWRQEYSKALAGANVIVVADRDDAGRAHAAQVAQSLEGIAASTWIVEPVEGKDARDHLRAGHAVEEFVAVNGTAPVAVVDAPAPTPWPAPLDQAAFHGLAGQFVSAIKEHSEADVAALLLHYLTIAGNLMGPGSYYQVEGDRHPPRLYTAICGATSTGRKGTAYSRARQVAEGADPQWADRCGSGLSSGEGPLWAVRDEITKMVPEKEKGKRTGRFVEQVEDPGVPDKRLLIVEVELSRHFDVMQRSGNTLSETVRRLWDGGTVGSLTKNNPVRATNPHVSIIGHISRDEVRRKLTDTEAANGFANRFLWVAVKRRQLLPFGGDLPLEALLELRHDLAEAVDKVRGRGERRLQFADDAQQALGGDATSAADHWRDAYGGLVAERDGMLGAILARGAPQVLRLAVTYACLDADDRIRLPHLEAALAVWDYCRRSAEWIFGNATGDPVADEILEALRQAGDHGLTRSEIRDLLGGRLEAGRIAAALAVLLVHGLARFTDESTGGRPAQRWFYERKHR